VGRWDGDSWVTDGVHSPYIDAADPALSYSSEPENNGNQRNVGRYGNSSEASKSNRGYKVAGAVPVKFELGQNSPNPFNPETVISFSLPSERHVTLKIYSINGQEIETLVDELKSPGVYNVKWAPRGLASGMYIYRIAAGDFTQTKRLMFIK
jgi:hypothetical protein